MKLGKILSYMSPAIGMATGMGLGKVMPYLSPGFGMLSGKGPFGGLMGGGGHDEQSGQLPQVPMPGQMGDVSSPMQPMQMGQPSAPTSFGQPTGMFGAGAGNQDMMARIRQMMMGQYGGGGY